MGFCLVGFCWLGLFAWVQFFIGLIGWLGVLFGWLGLNLRILPKFMLFTSPATPRPPVVNLGTNKYCGRELNRK